MPDKWFETFKPAKSDGTLPNLTTAQSMRYRKSIFWSVDLNSIGIAGVQKRGEWTVTFVSADGAQIYFKQTVGLVLFLVSLGSIGLQLFTWNYVKDTFDTSFVAGVPTTKDNIGVYLLGGTVESEQGDMRPASGADSTNQTATIIADWYSPIYQFVSPGRQLPPGYKVQIKKDTWGIGTASSTYQWAFEEGVAGLGTTFDTFGALLTARVAADGERVFTARAWPGNDYRFQDVGGAVKGSNPSMIELADGRELLILQTTEGVVEMVSDNSEWNWERMKYPDPTTGTEAPQVLFGTDATMPLSLRIDEDDSRIVLVTEGTTLFSRLVDNEGLGEKIFVGPAGGGAVSIERSQDGELHIIGEDATPIYKADSIPPSWKPVAGGAL